MQFSNTFKIVWWCLLVLPLTYVVVTRLPAFRNGSATVIDVLVLALWLLLFVAPVYSEVTVGSVTLKQTIEKATKDVREEVGALRSDIRNAIDIRTSIAPQFTITPPPRDQDLPAIEQKINDILAQLKRERVVGPEREFDSEEPLFVPHDAEYLFRVRYHLDRELSRLASERDLKATEMRYRAGVALASDLRRYGILEPELLGVIRELYAVCSAAI